jgi:hypothetical protein
VTAGFEADRFMDMALKTWGWIPEVFELEPRAFIQYYLPPKERRAATALNAGLLALPYLEVRLAIRVSS